MIVGDYEIKLQACNLCDSLHRNINDAFDSVSFDIDENYDIQVKIVMNNSIEEYKEELEDISVEYSALQTTNNIKPFIVALATGDDSPLSNVVYRKKKESL